MSQTQQPKETRQEMRARVLGISLNSLSVKPIEPSTNKVTKKSILEILTKEQKSLVKFYLEDHDYQGLTIQHLDPRQNRMNSVRYQFLKESGHHLETILKSWTCHQECGYFTTETITYFISFGDSEKSICVDKVHIDDIGGIGSRASTAHLFKEHPNFVGSKLKSLGMTK